MDIISKSIPLALTHVLLPMMETRSLERGSSQEIKNAKQLLNDEYGIYFVQLIAEKSGSKTILTKRENYTYIYSYNPGTNKLTLKGERKNAISKKSNLSL